MGTRFKDLSIGEQFEQHGFRYTKRSALTAVDAKGTVITFVELSIVTRLSGIASNIATKPDVLKQPEPSHETRITRLTITPNKFPLFCEAGFNIELMDEAAGEFVRVSGTHEGELKIDPSEWPILRRAIDRMIQRCRKDENAD
jgi:hypothetical protein